MGFIKLTCPNCGADIQLDETKEYGFCTYCGTKIMQDKLVIEHKGKISIDGIVSEQSYLDRAFIFIGDSSFFQATVYLDKVLDLNPYCSKAYIGKLLCSLKLESIESLKKNATKPLDNYDDFQKAKKFAKADELEELLLLEASVLDTLDGETLNQKSKDEKQKNYIIDQEKKIENIKMYLEDNRKLYTNHTIINIVLFIIAAALLILLLFEILLFATAEKGEVFFRVAPSILSVFTIIGLVSVLKKNRSNNQLIKEYKGKREQLVLEEHNLAIQKSNYSKTRG